MERWIDMILDIYSSIYYLVPLNKYSEKIEYTYMMISLVCSIIFVILIYLLYNYFTRLQASSSHLCNSIRKQDLQVDVLTDTYDNLYNVKYDIPNEMVKVTCNCKTGDIPNKFPLNVYNIRDKKTDEYEKLCQCDNKYDDKKIIYRGDNELLRYYKINDWSAFE